MTTKRYRFFDKYCVRTPVLPVSFYQNLTQNEIVSLQQFREVWENQIVKEAIFLASPNLYSELEKNFADPKNIIKPQLLNTFLKYISRMSSRSTPFGLFAGCSMGSVADTTKIELDKPEYFQRQTRFDMNFLVALSQSLAKEKNIKNRLLFYPNTSIYQAGKHLRYIEYTYKNNQRIHSIEAVKNTPYLQKILMQARSGKILSELATCIISKDISQKEAFEFVDELVANQLLVSELEPTVSGEDFLDQIIARLKGITPNDAILEKLQSLSLSLNQLDMKMGNVVRQYEDIISSQKELKISVELKYAFQTDLFTKTKSNKVSKNTLQAIKKGMVLLNKMTLPDTDSRLNQFKSAFIKRYEERELPLSLALDVEMGIGYLQNIEIADDTPILDDLQLPIRTEPEVQMAWNKIDDILQKKLIQAVARKDYCLYLTDDDFKDFEENWNDLPKTIAALAELYAFKDEEHIFFDAVGGSSAANLLARFGNGDDKIRQHTQNIVAKGESLQPDKIHAEIVHLPEARTGNILKRPTFRKYEIPYLVKSNLPLENQIDANDLMISVKGNRIMLRSKTNNKEVVPHLTNAHNYARNALPIYHFLCDMQNQNLRSSIYFSWGNVAKNQTFLPRVVYKTNKSKKTIIFSKAKWILRKNDLALFVKLKDNTNKLLNAITSWREEIKMPHFVQLVESDNTLVVNLENASSINMLLDTIKNKEKFTLEEFLFNKEGIVKSDKGYYTNQFAFSFYKEK